MCAKKVWNPAACSCKNGKYLASIIDVSVITYYEIIEQTKVVPPKTVPTNFNKEKVTFKKHLYFTNFFINYHSIINSC